MQKKRFVQSSVVVMRPSIVNTNLSANIACISVPRRVAPELMVHLHGEWFFFSPRRWGKEGFEAGRISPIKIKGEGAAAQRADQKYFQFQCSHPPCHSHSQDCNTNASLGMATSCKGVLAQRSVAASGSCRAPSCASRPSTRAHASGWVPMPAKHRCRIWRISA